MAARTWAVAAICAAVVATWWLASSPPGDEVHLPSEAAVAVPSAVQAAPAMAAVQPEGRPLLPEVQTLPVMTSQSAELASEKAFRTDPHGKLVLDERARLAMERLVALNEPEKIPSLVAEETAGLPAEAAARARELVERYDAYDSARRQTFPPGSAPLVPEDGLAELTATSALRESYFGKEAAHRMFGEEEAVTRRLLELMREDRTATTSMEQKAVNAQARYLQERPQPSGTR
jgi:hypothetical protein